MANQTLNAAYLQAQFNDSSISTVNAEVVLDGAINLLNTFDAGLDNLTGAAESKTGTYTSAKAGAIMAVALQIYRTNYKNADGSVNVNLGGLGLSFSADIKLLEFARQLARRISSTDPPIYVSNDPVPTE